MESMQIESAVELLARGDDLYRRGVYDRALPAYNNAAVAATVERLPIVEALAWSGVGNCYDCLARIESGHAGRAVDAWWRALVMFEALGRDWAGHAQAVRGWLETYRRQPHVFLSYSHANADIADAICSGISPPAARVYRDVNDFFAGMPLDVQIREFIAASNVYLIVLSRDYLTRAYTAWELELMLDTTLASPSIARRAIIVSVDGTRLPDGVSGELLRIDSWHDFDDMVARIRHGLGMRPKGD